MNVGLVLIAGLAIVESDKVVGIRKDKFDLKSNFVETLYMVSIERNIAVTLFVYLFSPYVMDGFLFHLPEKCLEYYCIILYLQRLQ